MHDPVALRTEADRLDATAQTAADRSEYPRVAKAAHQQLAQAKRNQAAALEDAEAIATTAAQTDNPREARRARRIARLKRKAAALRTEAAQRHLASHDAGSHIPCGQPILIGHHSERGHRAAIKRMHNHDDKAAKAAAEATRAEHAADAAERNRNVYADDPDAIPKLKQQLEKLEARREHMKARNKEFRRAKGNIDAMQRQSERLKAAMKSAQASWFMGSENWRPHDTFELTNIGANIRRITARIEELRNRPTATPRPPRHIGNVEILDNIEYMKTTLHFPSKPNDATRANLKTWGFRWIRSAGCWARSIGPDTEVRLTWLADRLAYALQDGPATQPQDT